MKFKKETRTDEIVIRGKLSTSQDAVVVSPYGIAPCHTAGHGNCVKILIEYDND